jgi:hypothetical protein
LEGFSTRCGIGCTGIYRARSGRPKLARLKKNKYLNKYCPKLAPV